MNSMLLQTSKLYQGAVWHKVEKCFYRLKANYELDKKIFPNDEFFIMYLCAFSGKQIKKKASTFLYEFFYCVVQKEEVVYFKDLNPSNFVPENVNILPKSEYKKLKDSIENLNGAIKISAHNSNAYMYIIRFKNEGKTVKYVCQDIIQAHKIRRIVLYKSTKILNRYVVTS